MDSDIRKIGSWRCHCRCLVHQSLLNLRPGLRYVLFVTDVCPTGALKLPGSPKWTTRRRHHLYLSPQRGLSWPFEED